MALDAPGMCGMADEDELAALRRFDQTWQQLRALVLSCASLGRASPGYEDRHDSLLKECRALYGRLSPTVGTAGLTWFGQQFDAFQHILGQASLSALLTTPGALDLWQRLWGSGASAIGQAIGRLEEEARQGRLAFSPDTVARWRWLILSLEAARTGAIKLTSRPLWVLKLVVDRVQHSLVYSIVVIMGAVGGCTGFILWLLGR